MASIDVGIGEKTTFYTDIAGGGDKTDKTTNDVMGIVDKIRVHSGLPSDLTPAVGDAYFDPTLNELRIYSGSRWWGFPASGTSTSTSTTSSSSSTSSTSSSSSSSTSSTSSSSTSSTSSSSSSTSTSSTSSSSSSSSTSSTSTSSTSSSTSSTSSSSSSTSTT